MYGNLIMIYIKKIYDKKKRENKEMKEKYELLF